MLHKIVKHVTTEADGTYEFTTAQQFTGRFLGLHTQVGTMATCTLTIEGITPAHDGIAEASRTLYNKDPVAFTDFLSVKKQVVGIDGALIAAQYDHQYLIDEKVLIAIASGGNAKTIDVTLIFDIEQFATHE